MARKGDIDSKTTLFSFRCFEKIKFQTIAFYVVQAHPMYVLRFLFLAIHTA
jgi:hypothetical protein